MNQLPTPIPESIGGVAKRGIAWALSSNIFIQSFQFAVGIVLARILDPKDFGVFAITSIFTGLAATIGNLGLGAALVQRPVIEERHRRTMLSTNVAISLLICFTLVVISPWVGRYFDHELAGAVLALVAVNFVINACGSVSFSTLSRGLRFKAISVIDAMSMVVHAVVAVSLALGGLGVWSIAWGGIAQSIFRCTALLIVARWLPVPGWHRQSFGELIGFGATITVKRVLNYCAANVDYFVIGKRLGPANLGFYTRAYSLMTLPLTQLSRVIMSVLFPAFSRMQDDNARLSAGYERVVTATAVVSFPFLTGLFLVAPDFIGFVYGEKWLPTVAPLRVMCLAGMMKSVSTFVGAIVDAKGRVVDEIRRQLVYLVLLVVGALVGSRWGTVGVAWAVVIASFAMLVMMQSLMAAMTGMRWRAYLGALWPPLVASLIMGVVVAATREALLPRLGPYSLIGLVTAAAVGCGSYVAVLWLVPFARMRVLRRELGSDLRVVLRRRRRGDEDGACQDS